MRHVVKELVLDEISAVTRPAQAGAVALLEKGASSLAAALLKALDNPPDNEAPHERRRREVVKAQVQLGALNVERLAAEMALDAYANEVKRARPELSHERAYVAAMDQHPELAGIAAGS